MNAYRADFEPLYNRAVEATIVCDGVSKRFGEVRALDNVSFEISGGIFALLGPNGSGKSTLLKILTGLLKPDSGAVRIAGSPVSQMRRAVGVVPEDLGLFEALTVEEHLQLSGPIYGLTSATTAARSEQLLERLGLSPARRRFAGHCSHGMRKKTALAMALLHNPRLLFLDEIFEGLDPVSSQTVASLLQYAAARGVTVFLTSHILPVVEQIAGGAAMLRGGKIVMQTVAAGQMRQLYFEYTDPVPLEEMAWLGYPLS